MQSFSFAYPLSGLVIGTLVGMTGVGGGSLMTPLLIVVFGMPAMGAVGVDLLFAAVTKAFGTAAHGSARTVEWRVAWLMLAGSIPTAIVVLSVLAASGPPAAALNHAVSRGLGVMLVITAASVALRPQISAWTGRRFGSSAPGRATVLTVLLGVLLGILVPITSVGAAAFAMPMLLLLYPGIASARLVGADIAHAVPLTLVAGLGHLLVGTISLWLLLALLAGSVPGVVLGSLLSGRVPDAVLRAVLCVALLLAGWRLLA